MPDHLVTYEDKFGNAPREALAVRLVSSVGDATPPQPGVALGVKAQARVDAGRWLADCPNPDCQGAEYVSFEHPFIFCHECRNGAVGNQLIEITVPAPGLRADIETYLLARPVPATRNWFPHESVRDLREENRLHGIRL